MSEKIKLGFLGGGQGSLIGVLHRVAANMFDRYELIGGVFSSSLDKAKAFADQIDLDESRIYSSLDQLIEEEKQLPQQERMQVISILTPNYLHFEMAKKLLENGFHVICEKPLTTTYEEALALKNIYASTQLVFAVTYTYTGYPMVRQMKELIAKGAIGQIQKVDIQYYQGWINPVIHNADLRAKTWRLDPKEAGISCCIGDIGSHGFDMLEYVTGQKVHEVLADLNYLYPDNPLDIDGTVLIRLGNNVKGIIRTSQIATGEENNFTVAIYGDQAGLKWEQENPNYLYQLRDGQPTTIYKPGNPYLESISGSSSKLPAGHPEGIFDAMGNIYRGVARAIKGENYDDIEFPTLVDGVRGMRFIEHVVSSHKDGNVWKKV